MPCLFAIIGAFAPRLAFILLWIFTPLVSRVFGNIVLPILGFIFLPFTTLFYVLVASSLGQNNIWGWLLILIGFLLDLRSYSDINSGRQK
ncbi:MAG: hypothetical protein M1429_01900 [Patescibacteria group bacterium]|nr:hypothetical protein [Patescibacteria group bacterium]